MKLCPKCQRNYEDDALRFCLEDGTPLVNAEGSAYDPGATIKIPAPRVTSDSPTEVMSEDQLASARATAPQAAEPTPTPAPPKTPARKYEPPAGAAPAARKSSAAPWILGAAVVLGLSAIAVAVIMTRGSGGTDNSQIAQTNQNVNTSSPSVVEPELIQRGDSPAEGETAPASPTRTGTGIGSGSGTGLDSKTPERPTTSPSRTPIERPTQSPVDEDEPPPPKPTPTRPSGPISGGVLNGKAISLPRPAYPPIARAARASGTVIVQVTIDESGNVIAARAVSGHPLLQQAAVNAARQARFTPTKLAGAPVKVTGVITYNFVAE